MCDNLTLAYSLPLGHKDFRAVSVEGDHAASVIDCQIVSVIYGIIADIENSTAFGSMDISAFWSAQVNSRVSFGDRRINRITPVSEFLGHHAAPVTAKGTYIVASDKGNITRPEEIPLI